MVDYIYEKLKSKKDQKVIVRDLLEDIISPDYAQTSKFIDCFIRDVNIMFTTDGVGCDNMTCVLIVFKK